MTNSVRGGISVIVVIVAVIACGRILRGDPPARPDPDAGTPQCPSSISTPMLTQELSACEARLSAVADMAVVKPRIVRMEGPPRRCATNPPEIEPVASTECLPDRTCLDPVAQRALAKNLASYEAWVRAVQTCERGEAKK
jgi:hypothetical protein